MRKTSAPAGGRVTRTRRLLVASGLAVAAGTLLAVPLVAHLDGIEGSGAPVAVAHLGGIQGTGAVTNGIEGTGAVTNGIQGTGAVSDGIQGSG